MFLDHLTKKHKLSAEELRPRTRQEALELGEAALGAGRAERAEQLATQLLKSNPADVDAALVLGRALLLQDRLDEAVSPLRRAARRHRDPRLLTMLAKALARSGRRDEAVRLLHELLKEPCPLAVAVVEQAELLGDDGQADEAVELLSTHLARTPEEPVLRVALGYAHLKRGDPVQACRCFEAVRSLFPLRSDALVGLARAAALAGDHLQAAKLYVAQLQQFPADVQTRLALARALLEMGRRREAEINLRAVAQGPPQAFGLAVTALTDAPHGRLFLRPSAAAAFLGAPIPSAARESVADRAPARDEPRLGRSRPDVVLRG